uniref:Acyl-CoA thioesterase 8 n=1 Tax=Nothobranchius furzeri TaxID=105023 RepID=A0A8C6LP10_NOTFU
MHSSSQSSDAPYPQDLRSVLVTSVLNLEELDVDLYRCLKGLNKLLANEVPIEIKPVRPAHFHRLAPAEPKRLFWARARGYIGEGTMKLHCCVAAYVSDFALLGTVLLPYSEYKAYFTASLDHAMWFHSTFRSDEWMLYECESPWAGQHVFYCFFFSDTFNIL